MNDYLNTAFQRVIESVFYGLRATLLAFVATLLAKSGHTIFAQGSCMARITNELMRP